MILVTGTKRSGTSMWMQVLQGAGFPIIGTPFPGAWEQSIKEANPKGFFESPFRRGVYYATNPDPKTGAFLHPKAVQDHVVKVFVPGLIRSDMAYLRRVLATMRNWRSYGPSLKRLYDLEDHYMNSRPLRPGESVEQRAEAAQKVVLRRGNLPAPVEWWLESYDLIRDVTTRKYSFHLVTYERLLASPEQEISKVLGWIGRGELSAALEAAIPSRGTLPATTDDGGIDPQTAQFFDDFYGSIHNTGSLPKSLVLQMNEVQRHVRSLYTGKRRDVDAESGEEDGDQNP